MLTRGLGVGGRHLDVAARPEPAVDVERLQILSRVTALEVAQAARRPQVDNAPCNEHISCIIRQRLSGTVQWD